MGLRGEANICAKTTQTGLKVRCGRDASRYPKGIRIADAEKDALAMQRDPFHAG